jgi:hypothetical protein
MDVSPRQNPAYRLSLTEIADAASERVRRPSRSVRRAIFAISSAALRPDSPTLLFPGFDKLVHAIEFGVLFLLARKATRRRLARRKGRSYTRSNLYRAG